MQKNPFCTDKLLANVPNSFFDCNVNFDRSRCPDNSDQCASAKCPESFCMDGPCVNGQCKDDYYDFSCTCKLGYEGKNCEIMTDNCASGPCQNGGRCTNVPGNFTCNCPESYFGATCSQQNEDDRILAKAAQTRKLSYIIFFFLVNRFLL